MGIRITTSVGYGLDISGLNKDMLNCDHLENDTVFDAICEDVLRYSNENSEITEKLHLAPRWTDFEKYPGLKGAAKSLDEIVIYQEEFGLKDKLLLIPGASRKSFFRYNDLLDWAQYEATHNPNNPDWEAPEWTPLRGCLYPYIGLMRANSEFPNGIEKYQVPCWMDQEEHKDAIPYAPMHLWYVLRFLKLVPEGETTNLFLKLKPTLYRYFC